MLISEAFDRYIEQYSIIKGQSSSTVYHYHKYCASFCRLVGDVELDSLSIDHVALWRHELAKGRTLNTLREYLCGLRNVLRYWELRGEKCLKYELIPVPKRDPVIPVFLSEDEVSAMINAACNVRAKFIISLLYSSGIRLSEFISLNRGQIKDRTFTVVGKGKKARICFIDERTERLMAEYLSTRLDNHEALCISQYGRRMTATNVQLLVRNAARRAGLASKHIHPHVLRHSFATNFLRNNGNMRYLSTLMGHANMDTTAMYAHVVDVDLKRQYEQFHSI